jgi:dihydroxyacid dehydratase/phosphogluconate dehydratase
MSHDTRAKRRYRSQEWFDNPNNPGMTALYLERYQNQSFTQGSCSRASPIIGIAQTGSDLVPCNKIHVFLMDRIKAGIRDAGGMPDGISGPSDPGDGQAAHSRARPQPAIPEPASKCCMATRSTAWC